ncbi:hypothetical protein V1956_23820 [Yersinia sp. 2540 StPb PI]|uniref:hypothetical protein n=1 Tax=Yersinia sp. 2540 StPb PI TaxID=3117406 RepID=UPI003FA4AE2C
MSNAYPENTPKLLIDFYESDYALDISTGSGSITTRDVIGLLIFDDSVRHISNALVKRFLKYENTDIKLLTFSIMVSEASKGPNGWESLTPTEQKEKISRIRKLATELSSEVNGTPFDKAISTFIDDKLLDNHYHNGLKYLTRKYLDSSKSENKDLDVEHAFFSLVGYSQAKLPSLLESFANKDMIPDINPILKRKTNPRRLFFIRSLSRYFKKQFGTNLYNITAVISSAVLKEAVTIDDVRSAMK